MVVMGDAPARDMSALWTIEASDVVMTSRLVLSVLPETTSPPPLLCFVCGIDDLLRTSQGGGDSSTFVGKR